MSSREKPTVRLSAEEARRVALGAQGFLGVPRHSNSNVTRNAAQRKEDILAGVDRLGVLQLDSVNVLCRAHYLPLFARMGAYDREALDAAAWREPRQRPQKSDEPSSDESHVKERGLFEYWGHMASLLPVAHHRLFRWRMERAANGEGTWGHLGRFGREKRSYIAKVLAEIETRGPIAAGELTSAKRSAGGWWEWSDAKLAVEWLFWAGLVTSSTRRNFERLYDLPERVLPANVLAAKTPDVESAHRELLAMSARALGIATEDDLCDYFRLSRKEVRPRLLELVEEKIIVPAEVKGWSRPAYLHVEQSDVHLGKANASVRRKEKPLCAALLAPFDPLIWYRPRAERLFDFHYRISIYTPQKQRKHGYYVLPFLLGDKLVGRVDLKSDRARSILSVKASHIEEGIDPNAVAEPLVEELERLAAWLGLSSGVEVARKGVLAPALRVARLSKPAS